MLLSTMNTIAHSILKRNFLESTVARLKPRPAHCLPLSSSVQDALKLFEMAQTGSVLILDDSENLKGIFTERDLVTKYKQGQVFESIPIKEMMSSPVQHIKLNASIARLMNLIAIGGFRHVPVYGPPGEAPRIISARDIVNFIYTTITKKLTNAGEIEVADKLVVQNFFSSNISHLEPVPAASITSGACIAEALDLFRNQNTGCLIVSTAKKPIAGILTERDMAARVFCKKLDLNKARVWEIMTEDPKTVTAESTVFSAFNLMAEGGCRNLPISTSTGELGGIILMKGLIAALTRSVISELEGAKR